MAGPGYFSTLGIPLLAGREFTDGDVIGAPMVAVVNEAFTRKFGLDGRKCGRETHVRRGRGQRGARRRDRGVVQDAKYNDVKGEIPPLFVTSYRQEEFAPQLTFYARTGIDPEEVMRAVPALMARVDPSVPVESMKTLERQIEENVFLDGMIGTLSAAFAVLATLLAAIGLYGVLAFTVAQRNREIGVRMALGAGGQRVERMILDQGRPHRPRRRGAGRRGRVPSRPDG